MYPFQFFIIIQYILLINGLSRFIFITNISKIMSGHRYMTDIVPRHSQKTKSVEIRILKLVKLVFCIQKSAILNFSKF